MVKRHALAKIAMDLVSEGILLVTLDREILYYNNAFEDILGLKGSNWHKKKTANGRLEQIMHNMLDKDYFRNIIISIYDTPSQELRFEFKVNNNRAVGCISTPHFVENELIGRAWVLTDITTRKQAEIERYEAGERYRTLMMASPDVISVTDMQGNILYTSERAREVFKTDSLADLMSTPLTDYITSEDIPRALENIKKIHSGDAELGTRSHNNRYLLKRADGSHFYGEVNSSVFHDSKGQPEGMISVIRDISIQVELEQKNQETLEELEQTNKKLVELNNLKNNFLAIASHDLRSPFAAILGASEMLQDNPKLDNESKSLLTMIRRSASTQLKYVNSLLDVLQLETPEMTLDKQALPFCEVIQESAETMQVLAQQKKISLEYQKDCNLCDAIASIDKPKMIQVLNNLIANAIKFTQPGGSVQVECSVPEAGFIEVHVRDTGTGITAEKLSDIFSKYKTIRKRGTEGEMGAGLGLNIARNLVELHGGSIHVTSQPGKGSDFYFKLPLDKKS